MRIASPEAMRRYGFELAHRLQKGDVLALSGPLGAGKTTLVQGLARGLGYDGVVDSPTFVLIQSYEASEISLHHMDMYRIESLEEAYDLGLEEYFHGDGICVVEWPEQIEDLIPPWARRVRIDFDGEERKLTESSGKEDA